MKNKELVFSFKFAYSRDLGVAIKKLQIFTTILVAKQSLNFKSITHFVFVSINYSFTSSVTLISFATCLCCHL